MARAAGRIRTGTVRSTTSGAAVTPRPPRAVISGTPVARVGFRTHGLKLMRLARTATPPPRSEWTGPHEGGHAAPRDIQPSNQLRSRSSLQRRVAKRRSVTTFCSRALSSANDLVYATRLPFDPGSPSCRCERRRSSSDVEELWSPAHLRSGKNGRQKQQGVLSALFLPRTQRDAFLSQAGPQVDLMCVTLSITLSHSILGSAFR